MFFLFCTYFKKHGDTTVSISTVTCADAIPGVPYTQNLTVRGGNGTYAWTVTTGSLPAGCSLNSSTGVITGTPTTEGTYNFTVQVDSDGRTDTQALSIITAYPDVVISTTSLANATYGSAYSQSVTATGGSGTYVWSVTVGTLPTGLSLNTSTGAITGTASTSSPSTFTIQAASVGKTDTQVLTINITVPAVVISTTSLANAAQSAAYSQSVAATGGTGTYVWSVTAGSLPTGLSLNSSTGAITGTPSIVETSNFTVQATSGGNTDTQALSIEVTYPDVVVTTPTLAIAVEDWPYSQTVAATGGNGTYVWSISTGTLPNGLSLNTSTGAITGTPIVNGLVNFTVQAASGGRTGTQDYALRIRAAFYIDTKYGDDGNDGKNNRPIKKWKPLQALGIADNDHVNVKRDSVVLEASMYANNLVISAYGTGEKPIFVATDLNGYTAPTVDTDNITYYGTVAVVRYVADTYTSSFAVETLETTFTGVDMSGFSVMQVAAFTFLPTTQAAAASSSNTRVISLATVPTSTYTKSTLYSSFAAADVGNSSVYYTVDFTGV